MHMADALVSPAVGLTMLAATAGVTAYSARRVRQETDEQKVPLMGVLGAFVFAAQMINFTIPGTGSSGHLGGGLLLAILLGPEAAFITMASILAIQALFFADGGLLALGANIFNLGFFPAFIAYPLIYKTIVRGNPSPRRVLWGTVLAAILGLQMGALGVIVETVFSGISGLPFRTFALLVLPIHLAIGLVEGLVTAAILSFVQKARPELLGVPSQTGAAWSMKKFLAVTAAAAVITAGGLSWFASANPDGLEWSLFHATGKTQLKAESPLHRVLAQLQEKIAFLPGYELKRHPAQEKAAASLPTRGPANAGSSAAGLAGAGLTLGVAGLVAWGLRHFRKKRA